MSKETGAPDAPIGDTHNPDSPFDHVLNSSLPDEDDASCRCSYEGKEYVCNAWICTKQMRLYQCTSRGWVWIGMCD
jgi:hypothetical protein